MLGSEQEPVFSPDGLVLPVGAGHSGLQGLLKPEEVSYAGNDLYWVQHYWPRHEVWKIPSRAGFCPMRVLRVALPVAIISSSLC